MQIETQNSTDQKSQILDEAPAGSYKDGQPVRLVIKKQTDLGYKAIVDGKYWGVLYYNEVFQDLEKNQNIDGFIKKMREDGRLDITLYKPGINGTEELSLQIIHLLEGAGGYLDITSKTEAEEIYQLFGVSKKKFKISLGALYKKRIIEIKDDGVYLLE